MKGKARLWHFMLLFFLVIILAVGTAAALSIRTLQTGYYQKTEKDLEEITRIIGKIFLAEELSANPGRIDRFCKQIYSEEGTRLTVITPDGEVVGDSNKDIALLNNHADREEIRQALERGHGLSVRYSVSLGINMMYLAQVFNDSNGATYVIRTARSLALIKETLGSGITSIAIASLIILLIALLLMGMAYRQISRPLVLLTSSAENMAAEGFHFQMDIPAPLEISRLTDNLRQMSAQLQRRIFTITRQKNEIEAILSGMIESVILLDGELRFKKINDSAAAFLNIGESEVLGKSLLEVSRNIHLNSFAEKALASGKNEAAEIIHLNEADGQEFHLQVHASTILTRSDTRSKKRILLVANDISRIKRLESIRKDFVANVSHELKTPVTTIKGFVETLQEGALEEPETAHSFLSIIAKNTDRLNAIIEDLLSLSRLDQFEDSPPDVDFGSVMESVKNSMALADAKAREKEISLSLSGPDFEAQINPLLLEQALFNLIENGIKYSPSGSSIEVALKPGKTTYSVTVTDNGKGIPEKDLPRIFERFYRVDKARSRDEGGTGLGLAIVKHIAQSHGGRITVESKLGKGSAFTMELPYSI